MDFDHHEHEHEHEEEMGNIPPPPGYESVHEVGPTGGSSTARNKWTRYRECLKNHAVGIGGHSVDGCGEFLAAGEEGTIDALKCAACNCHRNFHRKETNNGGGGGEAFYQQHHPLMYRAGPAGYLHLTPQAQQHHRQLQLALPAVGGGEVDEDVSNNPSSSGGGSGSKKRYRTKFTPEQKEKMLMFAERLGWRIQKQEEAAVEQFCAETGVKRQVLKVWMHNNKHTLGKKP